ncbi:MAG: hypothetical protein LBF36_02970, partial [Mycoplasmataceae bacterium]|nr:hypothetical protein [Mycoplasmataceae bacterium]
NVTIINEISLTNTWPLTNLYLPSSSQPYDWINTFNLNDGDYSSLTIHGYDSCPEWFSPNKEETPPGSIWFPNAKWSVD